MRDSKKVILLAGVILCLFGTVFKGSPAYANLVVNGSFETPFAGSGPLYFTTIAAGSTALPGWIVTGRSVDIMGAPRLPAFDGYQTIDLAGTPGPGGIAQTIATGVGQIYTVSFSLTSGTFQNVTFAFGQHSETVLAGAPLGAYRTFTRTLIADAPLTTIRFSSASTGNRGGIIDAVSVELLGDLNGDGFVGIDDLNIILTHWNANAGLGNTQPGDLTGDSFVGIDDLNTVLGNWNGGTPPSAAGSTVPEPTTLASLTLGTLIILRRQHG